MKKIYILFALILVVALGLRAQNVQFKYDGNVIGDTINFELEDSEGLRTDFIHFTNITMTPRTVLVQLHRKIMATDADLLMCFNGNCLLDTISTTPLALEPGVEFTEFDLQYLYFNKETSIGTLNILDASTMDVIGSFTARYIDKTVSLPKPLKENTILSAEVYPNPVANNASIKYNLPSNYNNAKIVVRNMVGAVVKTFDINTPGQGKVQFSTSDLQNGVYFYSIISNGKNLTTKKMIVKK